MKLKLFEGIIKNELTYHNRQQFEEYHLQIQNMISNNYSIVLYELERQISEK